MAVIYLRYSQPSCYSLIAFINAAISECLVVAYLEYAVCRGQPKHLRDGKLSLAACYWSVLAYFTVLFHYQARLACRGIRGAITEHRSLGLA